MQTQAPNSCLSALALLRAADVILATAVERRYSREETDDIAAGRAYVRGAIELLEPHQSPSTA